MLATPPHLHLRVFLASPGDVQPERDAARELMENALHKDRWAPLPVSFDVVGWDHPWAPTPMPATLSPQEAVSFFKTRPSKCDIVIVILRARMGTVLDVNKLSKPDGSPYVSGTEWEFEDAWNAAPRPEIMIYRCNNLLPISLADPDRKRKIDQYDALEKFLSRFTNPDGSLNGGVNAFTDTADFRLKLEHFLKDVIARRARLTPEPAVPPIDPPKLCLGRDTQTTQLLTALATPGNTAAIVLGQAGIGKTTLTRQVAAHDGLAPRFDVRRWFVALETATDAAALRQHIITALGLDAANPAAFEIALQALGSAPALLVLDNLETPADADPTGTEAVLNRLRAVPDLGLLASYRGTAPPDGAIFNPQVTLHPLPNTDALALFRTHAPAIAETDPALPPFLAALGGIPLAIELVARRAARHADLMELWTEWQARGPALARHPRLPEGRLTSLIRSLDLSWSSPRLAEPGKRLVRLLGLSPAGLSRQDRQTLMNEDSLPAMEQAVDVGLAFHSDGRLDLLPPVRGYVTAMQPATPEETDTWCRHFLSLAKALGDVAGKDGSGALIERLTPEVANLEAALTEAASGERRAVGVDAGFGYHVLVRFTGLGGPAPLIALATASKSADEPRQAANCIERLGNIALERSDHDTARARFEEALPLYRRVGAVLGEANCIQSLGDIALARSDHGTARARFEEALPLYRRVGDVLGEANCIYSLGNIALERSDHDTARARFEEALPLYRRVGAVLGEANCIKSLGNIALQRSDHDTARARFEEALPLYRRVGAVVGEANCIRSLGDIALARSDHDTARARFEQALPLYRRVGAVLGEANCILFLGRVAEALGDLDTAKTRYLDALAVYQRLHARQQIAVAHVDLADVTMGAERARHVRAAREAWLSMNLPEQAADVSRRFGGDGNPD